jgi:hypothetical protein
MKRRDFVNTALTGTAAIVTLPLVGQAAKAHTWANVLFREDNAGHWKGKKKAARTGCRDKG